MNERYSFYALPVIVLLTCPLLGMTNDNKRRKIDTNQTEKITPARNHLPAQGNTITTIPRTTSTLSALVGRNRTDGPANTAHPNFKPRNF